MKNFERTIAGEIDSFSRYSATDEGVTRLPFSVENERVIEYMIGRLNELGKDVYVDEMGNVLTAGRNKDFRGEKTVFCSHYDSVPNGGKYDGVAGVVFGILLLQEVDEADRDRMELLAFNCEESSLFGRPSIGSKSFFEGIELLENYETLIGEKDTLISKMRKADFKRFSQIERPHIGENTRFIEIHVDQSETLSKRETEIGVVEKIAGQRRLKLSFKGETNHSSLMNLSVRRDSLVAAASAILKVSELSGTLSSKEVVGTVTRIVNTPNVMNMIPGETELMVDIRGYSAKALDELKRTLIDHCGRKSSEVNVLFSAMEVATCEPAIMEDSFSEFLMRKLLINRVTFSRMNSAAWHDIAEVSKYFPSSLLLLPNPSGASHSPTESMNLVCFSKLLVAMIEIFGGGHHASD